MAKANKQKNDRTVLRELPESVVDNLIKDCRNQGDFEDLMKQISKRLLDGMLGGEMNAHLGI